VANLNRRKKVIAKQRASIRSVLDAEYKSAEEAMDKALKFAKNNSKMVMTTSAGYIKELMDQVKFEDLLEEHNAFIHTFIDLVIDWTDVKAVAYSIHEEIFQFFSREKRTGPFAKLHAVIPPEFLKAVIVPELEDAYQKHEKATFLPINASLRRAAYLKITDDILQDCPFTKHLYHGIAKVLAPNQTPQKIILISNEDGILGRHLNNGTLNHVDFSCEQTKEKVKLLSQEKRKNIPRKQSEVPFFFEIGLEQPLLNNKYSMDQTIAIREHISTWDPEDTPGKMNAGLSSDRDLARVNVGSIVLVNILTFHSTGPAVIKVEETDYPGIPRIRDNGGYIKVPDNEPVHRLWRVHCSVGKSKNDVNEDGVYLRGSLVDFKAAESTLMEFAEGNDYEQAEAVKSILNETGWTSCTLSYPGFKKVKSVIEGKDKSGFFDQKKRKKSSARKRKRN